MPDRRLNSWQQWQAAAGPWSSWAMCPALTMPAPGSPSSRVSRPRPSTSVDELAMTLGDRPTALIVDLAPTLGVRLAVELSARRLADVVLVIPRWPHRDGVLPTADLVDELTRGAARVTAGERTHVAFILDAERSAPLRRTPGDHRVDNRYDLSANELPTLADLRAAGIERVVKIASAA